MTRLYCKDCCYFRDTWEDGNPYPPLEACLHPSTTKIGYNYKGSYTYHVYPDEKNENNDCKDYEKE